jgi:hypothetical protein
MSEPLLSNFQAALAEQAGEEARLAIAEFQPRRQQLLEALGKVDVRDDEDMRRAIDKIVLSKALRETADAKLQPIGTPYRDAVHSVANVALGFVDELKRAERAAQKSIDAFRARQREAAARAKNEQREREEALRREAGLESTRSEPVKASDVRLGSARSDYRGQVFDRKVLKVTITDPRALPDTVLNAPAVIAAMESAVRRLAGLTRDIPGASIEDEQKSTVKAG